jgi:hypothetical protein
MSDNAQNVTSMPVPVKDRLKRLLPSKKTLAVFTAGAATTAAAAVYYVKSHQEVQDALVSDLADTVTENTDYVIDVTTPDSK